MGGSDPIDPLFALLGEADRAALSEMLEVHHIPAGARIFERGAAADRLYVVQRGRVEISVDTVEGHKIVLAEMGPGDLFGEVALLDGGARSANADAVEATDALSLDRYDLVEFLGRHPHAALDMLTMIAGRLRRTDDALLAHVTRMPSIEEDERATPAERIADRVAAFGGSWTFIILFGVTVAAWLAVNVRGLFAREPFDPYPYILLNLVLATLSALQAPVIMMSQNRQAAKDRRKSDVDFQVGLKTEIEIKHLHRKVERLHEMTEANFEELRARRRRDGRTTGTAPAAPTGPSGRP